MPGANANGKFAKYPMTKHDIHDEAAVAVIRFNLNSSRQS